MYELHCGCAVQRVHCVPSERLGPAASVARMWRLCAFSWALPLHLSPVVSAQQSGPNHISLVHNDFVACQYCAVAACMVFPCIIPLAICLFHVRTHVATLFMRALQPYAKIVLCGMQLHSAHMQHVASWRKARIAQSIPMPLNTGQQMASPK